MTDFPFEQLLLEGNTLTLGCNCTGREEDSIGTLSCRNPRDSDNLQQELLILSSVLYHIFLLEAGVVVSVVDRFSFRLAWCSISCQA